MEQTIQQTIKNIQAVIFDLDGVIVDSEPLHFEAHRMALEQFGIGLSLDEYLAQGVAMGDEHLYQFAAERLGKDFDLKKIRRMKRENYVALFNKQGTMRTGVLELIQEIQGLYQLGIASSGTRNVVELCLHKFNLGQFFSVVITAADVQQVKPAPDLYQQAVKQLGVAARYCVAIEDSESGLTAAKRAGLACIVIPCEFTAHQDFSQADMVIDDFSRISGLLS